MIEEILVQGGDISASRAIHEHGIEYVHADDRFFHLLRSQVHTVLHLFPVRIQIQSVTVEYSLDTSGDSDDVDLEIAVLHQFFLLAGNLFDKLASHGADTADEQVQFLIFGKEETVVNHIQRLVELVLVDQERDVGFGVILGKGSDVDAVPSQGREKLSGDSGCPLHVVTDHRDGGKTVPDIDRKDGPAGNLFVEGTVQDGFCPLCILAADSDRDSGLRCRLSHKEGADPFQGQGSEYPAVHTDYACQ